VNCLITTKLEMMPQAFKTFQTFSCTRFVSTKPKWLWSSSQSSILALLRTNRACLLNNSQSRRAKNTSFFTLPMIWCLKVKLLKSANKLFRLMMLAPKLRLKWGPLSMCTQLETTWSPGCNTSASKKVRPTIIALTR